MRLPEEPDGWIPLPDGWVFRERRVITRRVHDDALAWFPVPDPSGYAGIGLALADNASGLREFWMWTDESEDRTARIIRLGYRRYVVELCGEAGCGVVENPMLSGDESRVTDEEHEVLRHPAVSPARTLSSWAITESCARMWLDHGRVHDGYIVGRWNRG